MFFFRSVLFEQILRFRVYNQKFEQDNYTANMYNKYSAVHSIHTHIVRYVYVAYLKQQQQTVQFIYESILVFNDNCGNIHTLCDIIMANACAM